MDKHRVAVIAAPFYGQSHLNILLHFSSLLSSYGLPVHFAAAAIYNRQARSRINGCDIAQIHFHDLPIPHFASPLPEPVSSSSRFPAQLIPAWTASMNLREPFAAFLKEIAGKYKRIVVVHDSMMAAVVQDVASVPNAESYSVWCISAYALAYFAARDLTENFANLDEEDMPKEMQYLGALQFEPLKLRSGDLYNTCRLLEAPYLEILEREEAIADRKSFAIGPILLENQPRSHHKTLQWLDKQKPNSVIYIAFGSTVSLTDHEITEIALGLEQSGVKFLWILRDADKGDVFDGEVRRARLPEGFEERVAGVGMLEREWAPQPQILAHPATGGFMSHCGWNSCIESITMGVAMATWPMHSEQPRNADLITEVLKVGIVAREWRERKEMVKAGNVRDVVRRLMVSEEGCEIRRRAEELGAAVRQVAQPGGASRLELDSFIQHITR